MKEIKIGSWVMVKNSDVVFKVAYIKHGNGYDTKTEYISKNDVLVYEAKDLILLENANHIRNMFYNAPLGSLELEISQAINRAFKIDNNFQELTRLKRENTMITPRMLLNKIEKMPDYIYISLKSKSKNGEIYYLTPKKISSVDNNVLDYKIISITTSVNVIERAKKKDYSMHEGKGGISFTAKSNIILTLLDPDLE